MESLTAPELLMQDASQERFIDIPQEVRDVYKLYRPSPLYRAHNLEKALGTPAKIYYKYEGLSPTGSFKVNTAVAQVVLQRQARHQAAHHRDRRRPVGHRDRVRLPRSSAWSARSGGRASRSTRSRTAG